MKKISQPSLVLFTTSLLLSLSVASATAAPTQQGATQVKTMPVRDAVKTDYQKTNLEMRAENRQEMMEEKIQDDEEMPVGNLKKRQQLQINQPQLGTMNQEKQEVRVKIKAELKNHFEAKKEQIKELAVGRGRALLEDGAEFTYDEKTEAVKVMTPAGKEHILTHLPDVAIEKMAAAGLFDDDESTDTADLAVEVNELNEIVYRKADVMKKKLFGLFPRKIDSEIILNDATGEMTEQALPASSFFQNLLNRVSF